VLSDLQNEYFFLALIYDPELFFIILPVSFHKISEKRFCLVALIFCCISYCIHVEGSKEGQFCL
jgi:hypothetical protein